MRQATINVSKSCVGVGLSSLLYRSLWMSKPFVRSSSKRCLPAQCKWSHATELSIPVKSAAFRGLIIYTLLTLYPADCLGTKSTWMKLRIGKTLCFEIYAQIVSLIKNRLLKQINFIMWQELMTIFIFNFILMRENLLLNFHRNVVSG